MMRLGAPKQIEVRAHKENREFQQGVQQKCDEKVSAKRKLEKSRE